MAVFDDLTDVAIFLGLVALIWGDWYAPTVSIYSDYGLFKKWHRKTRQLFWLPPMLCVPIIIVILYVLMTVAFYAFYKSAFQQSDDALWNIPTVTFLFVFNLAISKQWIAIFMNGGRTLFAMLALMAMIVTAAIIWGIFGYYEKWLEFGTYSFYFIYWLGALYLNARVLYIERQKKLMKK